MRSLYEKLNRLDDSLVESKRIVKNRKLTESEEKTTIEVRFEQYTRSGYQPIKTGRVSGKDLLDALLKMADRMRLYFDSDYAAEYEDEYGRKLTADRVLERIDEENGDGCDFIFYIKNLTTGEMLFDSGYEESEDWDDDIDEMLTEDSAEQYTLEYVGKYGDTIARDYFDNYKEAEKFALELLDTYNHDKSNVYALIITDQDDNELFNRDVNIDEMLTEGNNVSSQLPPAIDSFLQDIAQMYETIDYTDIMQHEYSEEDIRSLKNLRERFRAEIPYEGDEEADTILQNIAEKVAVLLKR